MEDPVGSAPSRRHAHCGACARWVLPTRPHWGWRVAEVGFWIGTPGLLVVLKGFGVVAMPFMLLIAGGLAGPLRERAGDDPRCPECRRFIGPTRRATPYR